MACSGVNSDGAILYLPFTVADADNVGYSVIPNEGQVVNDLGESEPNVAYYAIGGTYFQKNSLISLVTATSDTAEGDETQRRLDITCAGPNANYPDPVASMVRDYVSHFYLPQYGPEGAANVPAYGMVMYPDIYPNIDLYVYGSGNGQKFAFVISPGGDPKNIELFFQGQDNMEVDETGNLVLMIEDQSVTLPEVYTFQTDSTGTILPVDWTAEYQANADEVKATFEVGAYDANKTLVLLIGPPPPQTPCCTWTTPGLCWSTFYGAENFDIPNDVKADLADNIYVTGRTKSGWTNFPHYPGASTNAVGPYVATLTKFNPAHYLQWTIFLGGNTLTTSFSNATAVAIKENPTRIYMAGSTTASDFFTWQLPGAYNSLNNTNNTFKGFLARFNASGNIQWSTYIGDANVQVQAIDVVPYSGQITISGITQGSLPLGNYLPPFNGYQFSIPHGDWDAFVALFRATDDVAWSAFYGGAKTEILAIVRWTGKDLVLAGNTTSANIPVYWTGAGFHQHYNDSTDIFIAQISLTGIPKWTTYFGGAGEDFLAPQGMCAPRDLFLTGTCGSLPTLVPGPGWSDSQPAAQGMHNGFIARFENDTHIPKWITYFGEGPKNRHSPSCITPGKYNGTPITIGGYTGDVNFPIYYSAGLYNQPSIVPDSWIGSVRDGFLIHFDDSQQLQWGTYFGGTGGSINVPENVTAVVDIGSSIYAVGYTSQTTGVAPVPIPLAGNTYSGMFFNPNYNYNGAVGNFSDGFITQFCNQLAAAKFFPAGTEEDQSQDRLRLNWVSTTDIIDLELPDGPHQVRVYDAQGRLLLERQILSSAGRSEALHMGDPIAAVYLVVVDNERTGRVVPIR